MRRLIPSYINDLIPPMRQSQRHRKIHLIPFPAELSILKTYFLLRLLANRTNLFLKFAALTAIETH